MCNLKQEIEVWEPEIQQKDGCDSLHPIVCLEASTNKGLRARVGNVLNLSLLFFMVSCGLDLYDE